MAFYNFTKAVLSKKSDFRKQITIELENLNKELEFQKNRKQSLSTCAKSLTDGIDVFETNPDSETIFDYLNGLKENIDYINTNIEKVSSLISDLNDFLTMLDDGSTKEKITETFEIYKQAYTEEYNEILDRNLKIEKYLQLFYKNSDFNMPRLKNALSTSKNLEKKDTLIDISKAHLEDVREKIKQDKYDYNIDLDETILENDNNFEASNENSKTLETTENIINEESISENNNSYDDIILNIANDNNTLVISEIKGKVFLPYKISDLTKKIETAPYKYYSLEDVIKKDYIIPINHYKYSSIARFKETFNLMRHKEKASFISSLELALELTFKYNLNPAIITACNNQDELDVYLDCLDEMELDDFKIFKIIYETAPTVVNDKNNFDF